jgi:hypothetical protein
MQMTDKQQPPIVPERIWLQWFGSGDPSIEDGPVDLADVTWEREPIFKQDIPYARVHQADDVRVAEIRKRNDKRKKFRNAGDALLVATTDDVDYLLSLLPQLSSSEKGESNE